MYLRRRTISKYPRYTSDKDFQSLRLIKNGVILTYKTLGLTYLLPLDSQNEVYDPLYT